MGKVVVTATVENLEDIDLANRGRLGDDPLRRVEVPDALVDTGATSFSMPRRLIEQLGLRPFKVRRVRTSAGSIDVQTYRSVRLTVQGRDCLSDVTELPDECPTLIGQLVLEQLDFVVDPKGGRLIGNPAHGGEWMLEQY